MQTFDQGLRNLYEQGIVTRRDALATASNSHDLRLKLDHLDLSRAQQDLEGETTATASSPVAALRAVRGRPGLLSRRSQWSR